MAELKKCPFCGGEAYKYISGSVSNGVFAEVICKGCYSRTDRLKENLAIEAWNNRVTEADIRAKAIEKFAEKLKWEFENSLGFSKRALYFANAVIDIVVKELKERETSD